MAIERRQVLLAGKGRRRAVDPRLSGPLLCLAEDRGNPCHPRHQRLELRLHLENHLGAALGPKLELRGGFVITGEARQRLAAKVVGRGKVPFARELVG